MTVKEKAEKIFNAYDHYMEDIGERLMEEESKKADIYSEIFQENYRKRLSEAKDAFFETPIPDIDHISPNAFFEALPDIDACMQVFVIASQLAEEEIPRELVDRIFSFGDQAHRRLLELVLEKEWEIDPDADQMDARDMLAVSMSALRLLGLRQVTQSIPDVLNHFYNAQRTDDYVADVVSEYASDQGAAIIPALIERVIDAESLGAQTPDENVLMILAKVGSEYKSNEIYTCLRYGFRKAERKLIALLCFRDYGDPNAIKMIRGYLDRHGRLVGREFFYEALSVIRNLGGDIDDITDPFKDFSGQ